MTATSERRPSLFATARASLDVVYREVLKFGTVGLVAFVVDFGVFNLMRTGIIGGDHGLAEKPLTAKTISVFAATVVAWLGNRYWTFRHRRRASRRREFTLFGMMNVAGLAIALSCLAVSHYVLGLTSTLADNIAGNVVGLGLGTLFRFWAYRRFVFTQEAGFTEELGLDPDGRIHTEPAGLRLEAVALRPEPAAPNTEAAAPRGEINGFDISEFGLPREPSGQLRDP